MYATALTTLLVVFFCLTLAYRAKARKWEQKYHWRQDQATKLSYKLMLLENQLVGKELDKVLLPAPQQTRIFGHARTEELIATWLEKGWSPLGDDLTDTENSLQIAQRIRRGEYLNEALPSENQQEIRRDAG